MYADRLYTLYTQLLPSQSSTRDTINRYPRLNSNTSHYIDTLERVVLFNNGIHILKYLLSTLEIPITTEHTYKLHNFTLTTIYSTTTGVYENSISSSEESNSRPLSPPAVTGFILNHSTLRPVDICVVLVELLYYLYTQSFTIQTYRTQENIPHSLRLASYISELDRIIHILFTTTPVLSQLKAKNSRLRAAVTDLLAIHMHCNIISNKDNTNTAIVAAKPSQTAVAVGGVGSQHSLVSTPTITNKRMPHDSWTAALIATIFSSAPTISGHNSNLRTCTIYRSLCVVKGIYRVIASLSYTDYKASIATLLLLLTHMLSPVSEVEVEVEVVYDTTLVELQGIQEAGVFSRLFTINPVYMIDTLLLPLIQSVISTDLVEVATQETLTNILERMDIESILSAYSLPIRLTFKYRMLTHLILSSAFLIPLIQTITHSHNKPPTSTTSQTDPDIERILEAREKSHSNLLTGLESGIDAVLKLFPTDPSATTSAARAGSHESNAERAMLVYSILIYCGGSDNIDGHASNSR